LCGYARQRKCYEVNPRTTRVAYERREKEASKHKIKTLGAKETF
jgi:hypothetical protein